MLDSSLEPLIARIVTASDQRSLESFEWIDISLYSLFPLLGFGIFGRQWLPRSHPTTSIQILLVLSVL